MRSLYTRDVQLHPSCFKCHGSADVCIAAVNIKSVHQTAPVQRPRCLCPTRLYGAEILTKSDAQKLEAFQTSCLRRLLGIRWYDFVTNASVMNQTQQQGICSRICDRHISIFGHVHRLQESSSPVSDWVSEWLNKLSSKYSICSVSKIRENYVATFCGYERRNSALYMHMMYYISDFVTGCCSYVS